MLETPIQEKLDQIAKLAPAGYSLGIRIRFGRPSFLRLTYSDAWIRIYQESNAYLADPTIVWGIAHTGAIRWSDLKVPDPFSVMTRAKANGLRFGATVAVGKVFAKSIAGFANSDREVSDEEIIEFSRLVGDIHEIIGHRKPLLDTHLRALELFSFGYSYDEMCTILSISRTALKSRLSGARRRLGAGSNVEAVRIAAERNLLRPHSLSGPSS